jgi:ribosomal protein S18 acetylase RimI-like enzyme
MNVREPDSVDGETIRDIAGRSLRASYGLSPETITALVEEYHADDRLDELANDEDSVLLVAEDDEPIGFAEGEVADDTGEVHWHHVAPEGRGRGAGTTLFERMEETLQERGAERVQANVLSDNMEGAQFFEKFGYMEAETDDVEIDGEAHAVNVFVPEAEADGEAETGEDRTDPGEVPETVEDDGQTLYVAREDEMGGDKGPFFPLFTDMEEENPYAFWCSHSETVVAAGDDLGRLECSECGNVHRADDWDAGYL